MLDIEKLMREGKTLEEIGDLVSKELNDAQSKIDNERAKAVEEENEKTTQRSHIKDAGLGPISR